MLSSQSQAGILSDAQLAPSHPPRGQWSLASNNKPWLLTCLALQRGWVTHLQAERVVVVLGPGVAAIEHVQHHTAAAPHVHLGVTALPHHHLWGHVGLCARHVVP